MKSTAKMLSVVLSVASLAVSAANAQWKVQQPVPEQDVATVQSELRQRFKADQEVRTIGGDMQKVDEANTAWLQTVTRKWGWIDARRFGVEAANAAFLIVQHSGNVQLMTVALPEIEKDVKAKRFPDGQAYALLYDRLQLMLGHKQRYGSQIGRNAKGEMVLLPLENQAKVDEYRKEMNMPPLAEYLALFERGGQKVKFSDDDASEHGASTTNRP
jgi:hypothetical protein